MKTFTRGFIEKLRPGKCRMIIFMLILAFALTVTGCGKKKDKQTTAGGTVVTTEKTTEKTTSGKSTTEAKTEASTAETLTTEKLTTEANDRKACNRSAGNRSSFSGYRRGQRVLFKG